MGSTTPNLGLYKPATSESAWGALVDANWDTLDAAGAAISMAVFNQAGTLFTQTGVGRYLMPSAGSLISVVMTANTTPTGSSIVCDVNKNGTTIFTTQANRPSIAVSANATASAAVPDVTTFVTGDYLSVDVDQIGSVVAGADLVVQVLYIFT